MFGELLEACKTLEKSQPSPSSALPEDILKLVPDSITAQDVRDSLLLVGHDELGRTRRTQVQDSITAALWAARAAICKLGAEDISSVRDADVLNEIADRISSMILPVCTGASPDGDTTDYTALQRRGELGLRTLTHLSKLGDTTTSQQPLDLPPSTLLRVTAFSNANDPWTTASSSQLSRSLLLPLSASPQRLGPFITSTILSTFLRPLFSKSSLPGGSGSGALTSTGRKAAYPSPPSRYDDAARLETPEAKPWKYAHRYAITVFAWAVQHADEPLLHTHWPLFTPALLTLVDEAQDVAIKTRALHLARAFWARCPAGLMQAAGLVSVFEDAVFPAALYLPSLTPEDESLRILGAAYPALLELAGLEGVDVGYDDYRPGYSGGRSEEKEGEELQARAQAQLTEQQRKQLDRIIREGIMVGYHHAKEYIRLVDLFCETLRCIVNGMGIYAVKHLKDLIPMVSEIMSDPFGPKHPPAIVSATKLLQAILRTCWPRIPHYCNEIIKALMLCWLNVEDEESFAEDSSIKSSLQAGLTQTADMLAAVMHAARDDINGRVGPLIEKEPQLGQLFRSGDLV
ncbi:hypothetical protein AAE478_001218 [Parahypoxylon ruwenzoriense]